MNEVFETLEKIGSDLSELRIYVALAALRLEKYKDQLTKREIEITPKEGWAGSNADARKASCAIALAGDRRARSLIGAIRRLECIVRMTNAEIVGYEDRRRGLEYTAQAILSGVRPK